MKPPSAAKMKLLLLHSSAGTAFPLHHHRLLLLLSLLSFFSLLSILLSSTTIPTQPTTPAGAIQPIPTHVLSTLLHYVPTPTSFSPPDLLHLSTSLLPLRPRNLLVFGLPHESLFLLSLNHHPLSLTVFLHHHPDHLSAFERSVRSDPSLSSSPFEAYDVSYATHVSELGSLLASSRRDRATHCRPVQHLLFSDCDLAVNDLPNHLYDIDWDVILVDGPSGYSPESPGRAPAIFTAAVLARSGADRSKRIDVFVHDFEREVERESSTEFLCLENLVFSTTNLAHFSLRRSPPGSDPPDFCTDIGGRSNETNPIGAAGK